MPVTRRKFVGGEHSNRSNQDRRAMKSVEWKTYRTRFLVKAKQLSSSLSFVDHLGRQHCGRKGDYLVESSDGVITITPRRIFEDIYVFMSPQVEPQTNEPQIDEPQIEESRLRLNLEPVNITTLNVATLEIEELKLDKSPIDQQVDAARPRRKLPQPCHDRRAPGARHGLM